MKTNTSTHQSRRLPFGASSSSALSALSALSAATLLGFGASLSAGTWQGGATGNWTDNNWGTGGYPGDTANQSAAIIGGGGVVTLDSNLPFSIGNGFTTYFEVRDATLNIGANITSNGVTYFGGYRNATINHTAGTYTQNTRIDFGQGNDNTSINSTYNLSGGLFDMNNNSFNFGYQAKGNSNQFTTNVSGGAFEFQNMAWRQAVMRISGGTVSSTGTVTMSHNDTDSVLWIDGSGSSSITMNTLNARQNATGTATLRFTADTSGFSALSATTLNLNAGTDISILELDLTDWDGSTGLVNDRLVIADYGTLNGTFSSVNVIGQSGGTLEYDYDLGGSDFAIVYAIPEPSAFALFAGGLCAFVVLRRRRRA